MGWNFDLPSSIRNKLQEAQSAFNSLAPTLWQQVLRIPSAIACVQSPVAPEVEPERESIIEGDPVDTIGWKQKHKQELEAWKQNPSWVDHPPVMQVSVPKGTLCHIESIFKIGIPPDAVFDIITDPENKRVFKNIKEVTYRKVLEDESFRQLVEVEQSAIWRFLCFSGTMSLRLFVDQDRQRHLLKYHLAKEGFMKKFEGSWEIKPVYVDAPHCELLQNPEDEPSCRKSRMASEIHFRQVLQPIVVPPPPISWYIRGISNKQTESLLEDLQAEAKRLREGGEGLSEAHWQKQKKNLEDISSQSEHLGTNVNDHPLSSRRRRRNSGWLRK